MGAHQLPSGLSLETTVPYSGEPLYKGRVSNSNSNLFEISYSPSASKKSFLKRLFDIAIVICCAPLVIPTVALVAIIIRLTSTGPIFFRHNRIIGKNDAFKMLKFRTMCCNADEILAKHLASHPGDREEWKRTHKLKNDPRITSIGKFLRKSSLDELPQLWHVLTGEMSLVGPRPIVTAEIPKYGENFVYYATVKPGIAGLWQASGRSKLTYAQRVALDKKYAEEWSFWFDIKILARTLFAVVSSDGAF